MVLGDRVSVCGAVLTSSLEELAVGQAGVNVVVTERDRAQALKVKVERGPVDLRGPRGEPFFFGAINEEDLKGNVQCRGTCRSVEPSCPPAQTRTPAAPPPVLPLRPRPSFRPPPHELRRVPWGWELALARRLERVSEVATRCRRPSRGRLSVPPSLGLVVPAQGQVLVPVLTPARFEEEEEELGRGLGLGLEARSSGRPRSRPRRRPCDRGASR